MDRRAAGYLRELLIGQNVERAAGGLGHLQPFYYYFPSVAADWMPWTLVLPAAALVLFRDPERRRLLRRLVGWIGFIVLFFRCFPRSETSTSSVPRGIRHPGRIGLAELDAGTFRWARFARGAFMALLMVAGLGLIAAGFWPRLPIAGWTLWPVGLVALAGGAALWRETRWRNPPTFFLLAALAWLAAEAAIGLFVYPAVNPLKTPVALARAVQARLPPDRPLLLYAMNGELLAYHSNRRGETVRTPEDLFAAMRRERRGFAVFDKRVFDAWPAAAPLVGATNEFRSGSRRYVWLEFDLDAAPPPTRDARL